MLLAQKKLNSIQHNKDFEKIELNTPSPLYRTKESINFR